MGVTRMLGRTRLRPRRAHLGLWFLLASLLLAAPVAAAPLDGGFSPTILGGGADLDGNHLVSEGDDANAFYGDTSIIDGMLDCDAWGPIANQGDAGDGTIDGDDDCSLVGYDGTPDGVTIEVVNGEFDVANGPLPTVFNATDPDNPDIGDSQFAWSAIDGRVDSNGDEDITWEDCHFDLVGSVDILGNLGGNECGFAIPPNTADNGLVDRNADSDITGADSCSNGCFFGLNLVLGKVQEAECPGYAGDPRNDVVGTPGPDSLAGTARRDIICGLGGNDTLNGLGGKDLLLGGSGADVARGGAARDRLFGGAGPDRLFGQAGNDLLDGGAGNDRCAGGPGADTLRSC
jgi:Ca2+-binding RTX toxin-like protein